MSQPNSNIFDPVQFSLEENAWLLKHLGETWALASRDIHPVRNPLADRRDKNPVYYPDGVNPFTVRPVIDRVLEFEQIQQVEGEPWAGIPAFKAAIQTYLDQQARWEKDTRRGAPRFPSMSSYDSKGRPFLGGGGSDAGQVRTYFDRGGNRIPFAVEYVPSGREEWKADWAVKAGEVADAPSKGLTVNNEAHRLECFCGHTEKFNTDSRMSFNAARARMSKHMRKDTNKMLLEQHRELHTTEFNAAKL